MESYKTKLTSAVELVKERLNRAKPGFKPQVAIVLGSGLGKFADLCEEPYIICYNEISGFPVSSVSGHAGRFVFGKVNDVPVAIMQGRVHMYEGFSAAESVLPIRLMGLLGAETIILTNAAGAVNSSFNVGDLMIISDHISSFVSSPIRGENLDFLGDRFPDMTNVYDTALTEQAEKMANIPLRKGVYMQLPGPQYETPAEIRMCRTLGADAVGMSTAIEAIAVRHMGMRVFGVSCITNMAAGVSDKKLAHEDVANIAQESFPLFSKLLNDILLYLRK